MDSENLKIKKNSILKLNFNFLEQKRLQECNKNFNHDGCNSLKRQKEQEQQNGGISSFFE